MEEAVSDIKIKGIDLEKITLERIFKKCMTYRYAAAAWRNPGDKTYHFIVSLAKQTPVIPHPDLEIMSSGFLVSPYENDNNSMNFFIHADLHFTFNDGKIQTFHYHKDASLDLMENILEHTEEEAGSGDDHEELSSQGLASGSISSTKVYTKEHFLELIDKSLRNITAGKFQKVVPSRSYILNLPEDFSVISKFTDLNRLHPGAFVSLFYLPDKGTWLGASPELLIRIRNRKFFHTTAVAGTQSGMDVDNLSEVAWRQKEIEEQAFVSRYIINCFKKIRLREFEEIGPKTVRAGSLLHLRTDYKVDMEAVNFPQLGSVMLRLLHPTSAVCGMPREAAFEFLKENEHLDREFYSGYLGPVNIELETRLYVNLRCAKINGQQATMYAGAGVTSDSNPEKEWRETELKMNTIRDVILG